MERKLYFAKIANLAFQGANVSIGDWHGTIDELLAGVKSVLPPMFGRVDSQTWAMMEDIIRKGLRPPYKPRPAHCLGVIAHG